MWARACDQIAAYDFAWAFRVGAEADAWCAARVLCRACGMPEQPKGKLVLISGKRACGKTYLARWLKLLWPGACVIDDAYFDRQSELDAFMRMLENSLTAATEPAQTFIVIAQHPRAVSKRVRLRLAYHFKADSGAHLPGQWWFRFNHDGVVHRIRAPRRAWASTGRSKHPLDFPVVT